MPQAAVENVETLNPDIAMIQAAALSNFFKALGDPLRLQILHLLHCDELTVSELVRILDIPQSSVSRHLKILKEAGLVVDRADGPATYYQAAPLPPLEEPGYDLRADLRELFQRETLPPLLRDQLEKILALRNADNGTFFDRIGLHWDSLREDCFGPTFHLEALIHLLPAEWTVADLGTGTGYFLPPLAQHFKRVIGIDASRGMIDLALRRVRDAGLTNVDLRQGDLGQLPLEAGEVDLALLILILHHLGDVRPALSELGRCVSWGGKVLIVEYFPYTNETFRRQMADRRAGIAPELLRAGLAEAGFKEFHMWPLATPQRPEHALAPLPQLYCLQACKKQVGSQTVCAENEP